MESMSLRFVKEKDCLSQSAKHCNGSVDDMSSEKRQVSEYLLYRVTIVVGNEYLYTYVIETNLHIHHHFAVDEDIH